MHDAAKLGGPEAIVGTRAGSCECPFVAAHCVCLAANAAASFHASTAATQTPTGAVCEGSTERTVGRL